MSPPHIVRYLIVIIAGRVTREYATPLQSFAIGSQTGRVCTVVPSARVAKLADAPDLGSGVHGRGGSSPPSRTDPCHRWHIPVLCDSYALVHAEGDCCSPIPTCGNLRSVVRWGAPDLLARVCGPAVVTDDLSDRPPQGVLPTLSMARATFPAPFPMLTTTCASDCHATSQRAPSRRRRWDAHESPRARRRPGDVCAGPPT